MIEANTAERHPSNDSGYRVSVPPLRSRTRRSLSFVAATICALVALTELGGTLRAQSWTTGSYLDSGGTCPPFVFVTMPKTLQNFGFDASPNTSLAGRLDLGDPGRQLWFMDKSMVEPRLLFPLPVHGALIAAGVPLTHGSVHEPSVYHHLETDQYWVFFSFAADLVNPSVARPCNLYALNITAAVQNPNTFDPATLPVVLLDEASEYSVNALYERSFNPELMPQGSYLQGVAWPSSAGVNAQFETSTGACVVDAEHGPVLYYASNARRTDGEGMRAGDLLFSPNSVSLLSSNEIMHFGTTSLISFFPTPQGAGGAYRSNTESSGQWNTFELRSDGAEWQTISGYGNQANTADHNGTTIAIGSDPDDSVIAVSRYYIDNNEGFGTIVLLPYGQVGRNYDDGFGDIRQRGVFVNDTNNTTNLFPAIPEFSDSGIDSGKFALPAAGRRAAAPESAELFLTYSHGPAHNTRGSKDYNAKLVVVTNISQKILPVSGSYLTNAPNNPVKLVLAHLSLHTFAMKPVLTSEQRFGWKHRKVRPLNSRLDPTSMPAALTDMPVAQVIAGPIYDTDVKSIARRRSGYYDPTTESRNNGGTDQLAMRVSCLTKDVASGYFANPQNRSEVWGLRIFVTDQMVRKLMTGGAAEPGSRWGYLHHNGGGPTPFGAPIAHERYRHLSDVPADVHGKVNFYLPANVPVKFQLLHEDGTVLAPHRNHHSFAPGQLEQRCTGCHQHVDPIPGKAFSTSPPLDLLSKTGRYEWDASGNPTFQWLNEPTHDVPEFRADIFPLLQSECSSCHDSAIDPNGSGLSSGFDLQMTTRGDLQNPNATLGEREMAVWLWLNRQRYVNRRLGAAKSPLAWHFTGLASDSTVRLDGETNHRYKGTTSRGDPLPESQGGAPSQYWITVEPGPANPHAGVTDKRKAYKVIEWIDAGAAIEHGATTPQGQPDPRRGVNGDGYQIALSARMPSYGSRFIKIGYWDVASNVESIKVTVRGSSISHPVAGQPNGVVTHDLLAHNLTPLLRLIDVVKIEAIDSDDNRSRVQKTIRQLLMESETHRGKITMTTNGQVFTGGNQVVFSVDADASMANSPFFVILSDDIYPSFIAPPSLEVFALPAPSPWFAASIGMGFVGQLDATGSGSWAVTLPAGVPPIEMYSAAGVFVGSTIAKSAAVAFKIQ